MSANRYLVFEFGAKTGAVPRADFTSGMTCLCAGASLVS